MSRRGAPIGVEVAGVDRAAPLDADTGCSGCSAFERIFEIDSGYQLRDTSGSPKIRAFFDELEAQLVPGYDPHAGADLEHAAPTAGSAGKPLEIEVRATRGSERVFEIILATPRRARIQLHRGAVMRRGARGSSGIRRQQRTCSSPTSKRAMPAVLPSLGSQHRIKPLEIALVAGDSPSERPWYTRWYARTGSRQPFTGVGNGRTLTCARKSSICQEATPRLTSPRSC